MLGSLLLLVLASAHSSDCEGVGCEDISATILLQQRLETKTKSVMPGSLGGAVPLPVGYITSVAGTPGAFGLTPDGQAARGAPMASVGGVHFHPVTEELWVSEQGNNALRVVDKTGALRTVAGTPGRCFGLKDLGPFVDPNWKKNSCGEPNDNADAKEARFGTMHGIEWDLETNGTYITDSDNNAIRYIDPETHMISSVVGKAPIAGYSGDGGLPSDALLNWPHCIVMNQKTKDKYVADAKNAAVRKIDGKTGIISTLWTFEGSKPMDFDLVQRSDGGEDLYLAECHGTVHRIDTVTGQFEIIAGKPHVEVSSGDGGLATEATFACPTGVQYDSSTGDIYISEWSGHTVRKIDGKSGIITTIAGKAHVVGTTGDDGPAKDALFNGPAELHFVPKYRWLFVQDSLNGAVRLLQV